MRSEKSMDVANRCAKEGASTGRPRPSERGFSASFLNGCAKEPAQGRNRDGSGGSPHRRKSSAGPSRSWFLAFLMDGFPTVRFLASHPVRDRAAITEQDQWPEALLSHHSTKTGKSGLLADRFCHFSVARAPVYNRLRKVDDPWPPMCSAAPVGHHERKISMATFDVVREVRIALTVERFDQTVQ